MSTAIRWTSADLEALPDNGKRYEIIDGDLFMSRQPHYHHQVTCGKLYQYLQNWSDKTGLGEANFAPGLIFDDDDDVAPDVIWCSKEKLSKIFDKDGKLHAAPELVIEVLSFGKAHIKRDREAKLKLYSRRGVHEYWIADWRKKEIEVYRREDAALKLIATLYENDILKTPLLPDFACPVKEIFNSLVTPDTSSVE